MNNDEKKISAAESEAKAPAQEKPAAAPKSNADPLAWWKNLAASVKAAIIAVLALIVIVPVVLIVALSGDGGIFGGPGGIINGSGTSSKKENYSVTVVTEGGMAMAKLPIYIFEYDNGTLGNLVDGGIAATDANGKAKFALPKGGKYAAKIDISIPEGYDVQPFYPLVSGNLDITISSEVIPEQDITGVSYKLGDIIHDFTVTTTEGKKFQLSEVLKTKKAVLINFWYDGCSWCEVEFPLMQAAYENYSEDLAIIALDPPHASGNKDTLTSVAQYKANLGLTFDVAMDNEGLYRAFGVAGYPFTAIVDRYGVIAFIEPGAITSQRAFDVIFDHFTANKYEQKLIENYTDIVPKEKPNVEMPDSDDMSAAFDGGLIDDIYYSNDEDDDYSWPFIISEFKGEQVIKPSNAFKEGSYAQLIMDVPLKAGEALAFDYFASTELRADILYVIVDGKDIFSISGPYDSSSSDEVNEEAAQQNTWKTCFSYVAKEDAVYEVALIYTKDNSDNFGDDTVYLKNLRICDVEDINSPTYIYRFAATEPDKYGVYQTYSEIFYNENDGYYHVYSKDGPILIANLMGYTRFSEDDYVYNMAVTSFDTAQSLYNDKKISKAEYDKHKAEYDRIVQYCNYASNSAINGVCPVTAELKDLLVKIALDNFGDPSNENEWLEFCFYYDSYGTDKELDDPIKGLAPFSAYSAILSENELERDENGNVIFNESNYPNVLNYDRPIMPRGLFSKFTPTESGTYLITSYAPDYSGTGFIDCEAWIFIEDSFTTREVWYTYLNVAKNNIGKTGDLSNVYMIAYFEAGRDYYINVAYADPTQYGEINFRLERLGGAGVYRFSLASPSFHTFLENTQGELTETVSGGIPLEFKDGYWREKRTDGRLGSILYVDFTGLTTIFQSKPIYSEDPKVKDLIDIDSFDFTYSEEDLYVLSVLNKFGGDKDKCREALREELGAAYDALYYDSYDGGDSYPVTGYAVEEVLAGKYHGAGGDKTDFMLSYVDKIIEEGDVISVVNEAGTGSTTMIVEKDSPMIGCVAVDAELAEVLQMLMDKYVFEGVENSWAKLCYYWQYFNESTPN